MEVGEIMGKAGTAIQIAVDVKMGDYEKAGVKVAAEVTFEGIGGVVKSTIGKSGLDHEAKETIKTKSEIPVEAVKKVVDKAIQDNYEKKQ